MSGEFFSRTPGFQGILLDLAIWTDKEKNFAESTDDLFSPDIWQEFLREFQFHQILC